jgi:transcriptional regulator with GAF, ATPase, and Fis domain
LAESVQKALTPVARAASIVEAVMSDLVDLLLGLLSREDPRRLGENILDLAVTRYGARRAAIWSRDQDRCALFLSRQVDQAVLDAVQVLWSTRRDALEVGTVLTARPGLGPRELRQAIQGTPAQSAALAPVMQKRELVGLLYVDTPETRFVVAEDAEGLRQMARVAAVAVTSVAPVESPRDAISAYLERMPEDAVARDQLVVLLERNEWNIARVARLLGLTRATIYHRLARFGIPRQR